LSYERRNCHAIKLDDTKITISANFYKK